MDKHLGLNMTCWFSPNTGIPISSLAYTKLNLQLYMTSKPQGEETPVYDILMNMLLTYSPYKKRYDVTFHKINLLGFSPAMMMIGISFEWFNIILARWQKGILRGVIILKLINPFWLPLLLAWSWLFNLFHKKQARLIISLSHDGLVYPHEKQARLIRTFQIDVQRFSEPVHVEQRSMIWRYPADQTHH